MMRDPVSEYLNPLVQIYFDGLPQFDRSDSRKPSEGSNQQTGDAAPLPVSQTHVVPIRPDGSIESEALASLVQADPDFPSQLRVPLADLGSVVRLLDGNTKPIGIGVVEPESLDAAFIGGAKIGGLAKSGETLALHLAQQLSKEFAVALIEGLLLGADKLKPDSSAETIVIQLPALASPTVQAVQRAIAVTRAAILARSLANTPSNLKTPSWLANQAHALAGDRLDVAVLDRKALVEGGFGGVLTVGNGSDQPPNVTVLRWHGTSDAAPKAIIGKGITFDSGGLSLKPPAGMPLMKTDMSGAAAVLGTFAALKQLQPDQNVVGVIACAENMPGSRAYRPGDVVAHYGGRTTEILNTDAEGRLVLADALAFTAAEMTPSAMIDVATLTGSATVGLGRQNAACYSDSPDLSGELLRSSEKSGDKIWPMPLIDEYRGAIDSDIADAANTNTDSHTSAGSITAALFLQPFASDIPWAHLDIAGVGRRESASPGRPKGATGFGVRLLTEWLTGPSESDENV